MLLRILGLMIMVAALVAAPPGLISDRSYVAAKKDVK
jgi:hypothetical protein